jgi:choline dehydrogenase-like flavoprotein
MGEDARAVVDTRLRFRGLTGLRVGDASAIPTTPVSALNAPSMLVGLRAARYALEDARAGVERAAAE